VIKGATKKAGKSRKRFPRIEGAGLERWLVAFFINRHLREVRIDGKGN